MAVISFSNLAYGDSFMSPEDFEIWSEDGTRVFRWNPPAEGLGPAYARVYEDGEKIYSIENLPVMGESASNFIFSKDLRYLVFRPTASQVAALGFFEDGILIRSYRIDQLVRDMTMVTYSVTMASWERWGSRYFDAANNKLTVETVDGITYIFDITTGDIVYSDSGDRPFITHEYDYFGSFVNEMGMPLWAIKESVEPPVSIIEDIEPEEDIAPPNANILPWVLLGSSLVLAFAIILIIGVKKRCR